MQSSEHADGESNIHRKLAAIMFTDMVGYSALAQKDEMLSIELLNEHRRILRSIFQKHSGNEIETIGDAFFVEFTSALEAAECAIEIQETLDQRNKTVEQSKSILLRIGLHIGDVLFYEKHVHGDGVNIAARLEPLSPPGGICVSEDFARAIHNKINYPVVIKGKTRLKNISESVNIYLIQLPWVKNNESYKTKKDQKKNIIAALALVLIMLAAYLFFSSGEMTEMNRRIAVLPFLNFSDSLSDEYFADGMTEQIITNLSNISGLNVIARSSVLKYKENQKPLDEIGSELNVGTVLEGTIRKSLNKARITVQLIDVATLENIWAKDYDRELKDIFMVQSDIAGSIAKELKVKLLKSEAERVSSKREINTEAYRNYLLGKFYFYKKNLDGLKSSINHYNTAIEHDKNYAEAYAGLADTYTLVAGAGYDILSVEEATKKANMYVQQALRLNPDLGEAYASLAYIKFRLEWKFDSSEVFFKKALELKPGYAQAHEWYALYLSLRARYDEALAEMKRAAELDPLSPGVINGIGRIYYFMGKYDEAESYFNKAIKMNADYAEAYHSKGMNYAAQKKYKEAITEFQKAIQLSGGRLIMKSNLAYAYAKAGLIDSAKSIINELNALSKHSYISPYNYVMPYLGLGDIDKAFQLLNQAYEEKYGLLLYLKADHNTDELKQDDRYQTILKKIGL